jgi:beta-glucanase (GH16 family)
VDAAIDPDMHLSAYTVAKTDNTLSIRAGHYLALEAAILDILDGRAASGLPFSGTYSGDVPLTRENMVLVWNDEFDGDRLDPAKWMLKAKMSQEDILNGNGQRNVTVTDGALLLRSWKEDEGAERPYSTNTSVTTDGTFSYKYGYLEMSAIVPYEAGAWPSFWLLGSSLHQTSPYRAEVDVLEVFGSTDTGYSELHKALLSPNFINYALNLYPEEARAYHIPESDKESLRTAYHRYGFGWTPTEMYFTFDGEVYFSHDITERGNYGEGDMACFHDPLYVIFNNFLFTEGSSWKPSLVTEATKYPIEYRIDWVRLYQTPGVGEAYFDGETADPNG